MVESWEIFKVMGRVFGGGEGKRVHPKHDDRNRIGIKRREKKRKHRKNRI